MIDVETVAGAGLISASKPNGRVLTFPSVVPDRLYPRAKVRLDFRHERLADLVISLETPAGDVIRLRNREGIGGHDGPLEFDIPIGDVTQQNGVWRVRVLDYQKGDGGEVRKARLELFDQGGVEIKLLLSGVSPSQEAAFHKVANDLMGVIVGVRGAPRWTVTIEGGAEPIDGPGQILGQAGPTRVSTSLLLPFEGVMLFDSADMDDMEADGSLPSVLSHEILHVMGVGTLWSYHHRSNGEPLVVGADFLGEGAVRAWAELGQTGPVPIETLGGAGTAGGHWLEKDQDRDGAKVRGLGRERMTGWLNSGLNPLSIVTVASLGDIGWEVDLSKADPFSLSMAGLRSKGKGKRRPCRVQNAPKPEFV